MRRAKPPRPTDRPQRGRRVLPTPTGSQQRSADGWGEEGRERYGSTRRLPTPRYPPTQTGRPWIRTLSTARHASACQNDATCHDRLRAYAIAAR
eukprot:357713-Chlamydomonas_euryale.AAC.17